MLKRLGVANRSQGRPAETSSGLVYTDCWAGTQCEVYGHTVKYDLLLAETARRGGARGQEPRGERRSAMIQKDAQHSLANFSNSLAKMDCWLLGATWSCGLGKVAW